MKLLTRSLNHILSQNKKVVIMGDFNLPNIDWTNNAICRDNSLLSAAFIETIEDNYAHQHVLKPTRYRHGQEANILDLVLTQEENQIQSIQFQPGLGKSDHIVLLFTLKFESEINNTRTEKLNYNKGDYPEMILALDDQ